MKAVMSMESSEIIGDEEVIILNQEIDTELLGIQEQQNSYDVLEDQVSEASSVADTLMEMQGQITKIDNVTPQELDVINIAVEHFCKRLDYKKKPIISLESYSSPRKAAVVAMEGLGSFIESIWEAIKSAFNRLMEWIKSIWNSIFGAKQKIETKVHTTQVRYDNIELPKLDTKKLIDNLNQNVVPKLKAQTELSTKENLKATEAVFTELKESGALGRTEVNEEEKENKSGVKEEVKNEKIDNVVKVIKKFCSDERLNDYFRSNDGSYVYKPKDINVKYSELLHRYKNGEDCFGIGRYLNNYISYLGEAAKEIQKIEDFTITGDGRAMRIGELDKISSMDKTTIKGIIESLGIVEYSSDRNNDGSLTVTLMFPFDRYIGLFFKDKKVGDNEDYFVTIDTSKFTELKNKQDALELMNLDVAKNFSKINVGFLKDIGKDLEVLKRYNEKLNGAIEEYKKAIENKILKYKKSLGAVSEETDEAKRMKRIIAFLKKDSVSSCQHSTMLVSIAFELAKYAEEAILMLDRYINYTADVVESA